MSAVPRQRGFTLIEVMVVVVIVGIMSAVVLMSLNLVGNDRQVRQEARRLASLVELAADEALLQGRELGLEFTTSGYRFVEFDPYGAQWHAVAGDELLRERRLPEGLRFYLYIEDKPVTLREQPAITARDDEDSGPRTDYAPHALLMSSGEITPFELMLERERDRQTFELRVTPAGDVEYAAEFADAS